MSYIERPSGNPALLADVLQCCLFQRKRRTSPTASVRPGVSLCEEKNSKTGKTSYRPDVKLGLLAFDELLF